MKDFIPFLACLLLGIISSTAEAEITINSSFVLATAREGINSPVHQQFTGTTIPTSTAVDAITGNSHSKNMVDWSVSGGQTILKFDMDHTRTGASFSGAGTSGDEDPILRFIANSTEPYTLSGYYNVTDVGSSGLVAMNVSLNDQTSSLFTNSQTSINTTNEQFVLGGTGGDSSNSLSGSVSGSLIAGQLYTLNFSYFITPPDIDAGASALGNLTLTIGPPSPPGDFNHNGVVDAADYVVWRKMNGPSTDYDLWRSHYGEPISGSGSSIESASVPEPSTLLLLGVGEISLLGYRKSQVARLDR